MCRGAIAALEEVHDAAHDPDREQGLLWSRRLLPAWPFASTLFAADRENYKLVADVYRKTQDRWVLGDFSVRASFFTDWHNWCQVHQAQRKAARDIAVDERRAIVAEVQTRGSRR